MGRGHYLNVEVPEVVWDVINIVYLVNWGSSLATTIGRVLQLGLLLLFLHLWRQIWHQVDPV